MPFSVKTALVAALASFATAFPSGPKLNDKQMKLYELARRQTAGGQQAGLTDIDILQFALTLEWLEGTFYQQGFAMFPPEQFAALGLNTQQIDDLRQVGATEFSHVTFLQSAIAQAGTQPVQPCQYNFGFTDAAGMVGTAAVLESVGVSAYLGAAPLVADKGILSAAGSILTVEARHQTFIRAASNQVAIPQGFDTPLGPRAVFSLAAPFITSCPEGSNLAIQAFPKLTLAAPASPSAVAIGSTIQLQSDAAPGAVACAFTNGGILPGGTAFTAFNPATGCEVPQNLAGITYVSLTSSAPIDGVITDAITVAGPTVLTIS
ncbi:twin-arginine translocation pathway signal [Plectosphaerella cucumerina]|uniref:Twin-arginine translocation pathway signal n=1 Tax=Plectosphaerella cucumerina TaxID=40658 RepID=A0A8K0TEJ5_9PEZI|nr:twin-arginine translocation pathway signal [Plectosphaerella cucumerina]